jgi:formylglycine-generating enzyme required for sulfatase activity
MRAAAIATMAAVTLWGAGCNSLIGIDGDYTVGEAGAGASSAGGHGGGAGPGSGGSASSGAQGSGGAGASATASTGSGNSGGTGVGGGAACPSGAGPTMIAVGAFCIDATEVTNADYAVWLATDPDPATQPSVCSFNGSFTPSGAWPADNGRDAYPVIYVDWCDAVAYCSAAGKRLCGQVGGGALPTGDFADPAQSQWMAACSADGAHAYPYGGAYNENACNGADYGQPDQLLPTQAAVGCRGTAAPYSDVYDLSGNVHEWEDSCSGENGATDTCRRRGGSYKSKDTALSCDANDQVATRGGADGLTGFRCCSN